MADLIIASDDIKQIQVLKSRDKVKCFLLLIVFHFSKTPIFSSPA